MINTDIGILHDIHKRLSAYVDEAARVGQYDEYYTAVGKIIKEIEALEPVDDNIIEDFDRLTVIVSKVAVILPYLWV